MKNLRFSLFKEHITTRVDYKSILNNKGKTKSDIQHKNVFKGSRFSNLIPYIYSYLVNIQVILLQVGVSGKVYVYSFLQLGYLEPR